MSFLQISKEHTFRINSEIVLSENLNGRLREIFRPRAERVLLVRADPDVSFQEVVGAIDNAEGARDKSVCGVAHTGRRKGTVLEN